MWTKESNLADDDIRVVEFNFETNEGPGSITAVVNKGISIDEAIMDLMDTLDDMYTTIEMTHHEIVEVIIDPEDTIH